MVVHQYKNHICQRYYNTAIVKLLYLLGIFSANVLKKVEVIC